MSSLTREEGVQLDEERVTFVDRVMFSHGFTQHSSRKRFTGAYHRFTWTIAYLNDESGDTVVVSFPHEDQAEQRREITTQAQFNKKMQRTWNSLYEFEEEIGPWIEECRRKTQGQ